ncbi:hypothetical protein BZM27_05710 [Paraburkholderia steynii]|uniref:ATP-grasp fold PylC-type domain-containing protein n=1 Tax=Paraburkholderia steynii TaxID=1245441 RepID=A0A4R0XMN8_9BURK|nr:hypothetical protein BZM27_05710 [Paraburkholderia steynii]
MLQAWVDGDALSLSLICDQSARRSSASTGSGSTWRGPWRAIRGRWSASTAWISTALIATARKAARSTRSRSRARRSLPGLRGFAGIDVVWHPARGPVVIEVNPRATVAYAGLSARLGRNLAADVLAAHGLHVATSVRDAASGSATGAKFSACGAGS